MGHIPHLRNSLNQKAYFQKAMIKLIKRKNIISFNNLTKVRPLLTLSHRGSDSSP